MTRLFVRLLRGGVTHVLICRRLESQLKATFSDVPTLRTLVVGNGHVLRAAIVWGGSTSPRDDLHHGQLVVGHMSNLEVGKGFAAVGEAVALLRNEGYDVVYHLAGLPGDGDAQRALENLRGLLGDALVERGFVTTERKRDFFRGLDVFAHPSCVDGECYSITVWEALAHGVPIVAVEAGCLNQEAIGNSGEIVATPTAGEVAAAIARLAHGPDRRSLAHAAAAADLELAEQQIDALSAELRAITSRERVRGR